MATLALPGTMVPSGSVSISVSMRGAAEGARLKRLANLPEGPTRTEAISAASTCRLMVAPGSP